ncbi:MAG: DegT/DnrJ/EryC1/StrS family aminotransferase, partial [Proteobacteria bacterium]|nr:DegT/DnrJ/EryC1/StrS family aminotransferase [Pseudomonadota bacterium]
MRNISVFIPDLPKTDELIPYLRLIDEKAWYSNFGPLEKQFKQHLLKYFQCSKSVDAALVCNGTLALQLGLMAFDLPEKSYCLMPSWTFSATGLAVLGARLTPYFIDVDPLSWMITPELVENVLCKAKISCVIVVCPFGKPIDITPWEKLQEKWSIPILIDAAAVAVPFTVGKIPTIVSLHATKLLGIGEGGVVLSKDTSYIEKIKSLSNFGFCRDRLSLYQGTNAKLNEYNAAVGLAMLKG